MCDHKHEKKKKEKEKLNNHKTSAQLNHSAYEWKVVWVSEQV